MTHILPFLNEYAPAGNDCEINSEQKQKHFFIPETKKYVTDM